jgi:glycosyltransferase involved in cell wall biosynthesis
MLGAGIGGSPRLPVRPKVHCRGGARVPKVARVVIVSDFGEVNGGAAKVAIASARTLAERGVKVVFVCAIAPVTARLQHAGIDVYCLGLRDVWSRRNLAGAALAAIWNAEARQRFEQLLRQIDPVGTVIHIHQWTKGFSPSVLLAARKSPMPCLVSMHDYFLVCPNGSYFSFSHEQPCTYSPMSLSCICTNCDSRSYAHKGIRLIRQVAIRRVTERCKDRAPLNVVHVSAFARSVAEPMLPASWRHFVVPNPVDVEKRRPVAVERNRDFVFIGRFTSEKKPVRLAEAARQASVPAAFLGEGPEADRIRAAYPAARVLPWADAKAVEAVLENARALVFPSVWYETSGLVVAEALARGVPAIASQATGARDLIQHGNNGLLFPPDDSIALVRCIESLRSDDVARRMGRNAFAQYWKAPLSGRLHADRLLDVYNAVLDDGDVDAVMEVAL